MKITLGETLKIAKEIETKIGQLRNERQANSTITYGINETAMFPDRTVDEITGEIEALGAKARFLRNLATVTNIKSETDFELDGRRLTVGEALLYLNHLLAERQSFARLSGQQKLTREATYGGAVQFTAITYDMAKIEKTAKRIDKEIREVRKAIDKANINTEIEVADEIVDY